MLKDSIVEVKWRKNKFSRHEIWEFWSCNIYFSYACLSIHKKRNSRRIFLEFAKYRQKFSELTGNESSFWVEEKFIYKKLIE